MISRRFVKNGLKKTIMNRDLGKAFRKLVDDTWVNYKGALLEKGHGGYYWGNNWYGSIQAAEKAVDEAKEALLNSINRLKK